MADLSKANVTAAIARLFAKDFLIALLVFAACASAFNVSSGNAFPLPPPAELLPAAHLAAPVIPAFALTTPALPHEALAPSTGPLLAIAFSTLMALNMAVWRHLRTAYASPRRRS